MFDFDPRDVGDARDRYGEDVYDPRWGDDPRERDERERDADARDHDPRDVFVHGLELPRGRERELVQDERENLYELNGEDARMLATIGAFRVVAEADLEDVRDTSLAPRGDALEHLADEGLIRFVDTDADHRAAVLTGRGHDVLEAHRRDRGEDPEQAFHAGVGRARELQHDAQLFHAYLEVERRLRDEGAAIERIVLERDLRREYQEFLQEHNRDRPDSDGRPDRDAREIEQWAREHELPYFDGRVHLPDVRIEYELDSRDRHEDVEVLTPHYRGAHGASRARAGFTCFGGASTGRGGSRISTLTSCPINSRAAKAASSSWSYRINTCDSRRSWESRSRLARPGLVDQLIQAKRKILP